MIAASCTASDNLTFLRQWARRPLRVASVTPSGRALSRLITREINAGTGSVLELGPGTGVFTAALLSREVPENKLTLIETDVSFAALLTKRYSLARIVNMDASKLGEQTFANEEPFGAVVSGLPLLSMPPETVKNILKGSFACMGPDASLYQFTYGLKCPVSQNILDDLGLKAVRIGWTWRNFPPAGVYRFSRVS